MVRGLCQTLPVGTLNETGFLTLTREASLRLVIGILSVVSWHSLR